MLMKCEVFVWWLFLALEWIVKGAIYAFPSSTFKFAIVMLIKQLDAGMQLD